MPAALGILSGWQLPAEEASCKQAVQQQWALLSQIANGYEDASMSDSIAAFSHNH